MKKWIAYKKSVGPIVIKLVCIQTLQIFLHILRYSLDIQALQISCSLLIRKGKQDI